MKYLGILSILLNLVYINDVLFVAGHPDVLNEDEAIKDHFDTNVVNKTKEQLAAFNGLRGALL